MLSRSHNAVADPASRVAGIPLGHVTAGTAEQPLREAVVREPRAPFLSRRWVSSNWDAKVGGDAGCLGLPRGDHAMRGVLADERLPQHIEDAPGPGTDDHLRSPHRRLSISPRPSRAG